MYCPVILLTLYIVGSMLVCIDQLLDSITLVSCTKPQLACDLVFNADKDRTDRHENVTRVGESSYDDS